MADAAVNDALLRVKDLHVRYQVMGPIKALMTGIRNRFVDAVIDVSFDVKPGTTFALVGESGSGKSSLGRAVIGLTPIQSGRVTFDGAEPLLGNAATLQAYRRNVAMMFQDPVASLSPRLSVQTLITEPFLIHGMGERDRPAEARRLLGLVGLPPDFASRYPHQLSGGQARRVGVARALALSPKLIIADEPTAGLDVSVQGDILNLLSRLQRELGLTYVIITHNLAVVRHVSDEMAIMYMGRFVERGPTGEIFRRPGHPYTHGLLAAQPVPDPDRRRGNVELQGEVPSLTRRPAGCEFHTRCPHQRDNCRIDRPGPRSLGGRRELLCHYPLTG
ncbi:MAG TPA: ABC transporter ATP-binding protein [Verrucomicrobiae bacterium]|nr:ABC transporter ATP-binding protein [Verrucomicrobiae bacterium]